MLHYNKYYNATLGVNNQIKTLEWLMLNFTLPKEPSRVRVSVWRKLKKSGSVNIGQSLWLLPLADTHEKTFQNIAEEILQNNGDAYILRSAFISMGNKSDIREMFNKARDEEYKEFIDKCEDCQYEIKKETKKSNFSFAEIEENERELQKLTDWLGTIDARDFFGASLKKTAGKELSKCRTMLDQYCSVVYERNTTDNNYG